MANSFEKLKVWQRAHEFVLEIFRITKAFPKAEAYSLVNQVCRSASSVAANIVEGNSRSHRKEFLQFINTAYSSLEETKYHLMLSRDLGYLNNKKYDRLILKADEIGKMLNSLRKYLKSNL